MNKSIEIELSDNGNNLYIFFGGSLRQLECPFRDFITLQNHQRAQDVHKRFLPVLVPGRAPEISEDIFFTAQHIKKLIGYINPGRVYFVGNSMGGYVLIAFSELLWFWQGNRVLTSDVHFSPIA